VGIYELTFVQTNGVCNASDNVSVTLRGAPTATLSTDSEICGTGEAEIDFELQGFSPLTVDYSFGNDTEQFTTADLQHTQTHILSGETTFQILTVTDVYGCTTTYTNETGTTAIVADILPTAYAGDDRVVCADEITLSAAEPAFGTGTWSGGGSFSNVNDKNSVFYPDPFTGEVTKPLTWTVQNKHCSATDQITVTFYEQPAQTDVWAGKDTLLYEQKSYYLDATPPPFGEGAWSIIRGNGNISEPSNPNAEITQLGFGQTLLRWTLSNGDCATVWHEIEISMQTIQHPTGFSPNRDGKNDLLRIPGAEFIENNQLIVFNQQGTVVYKTNNYQNNWSGTKENGEILPDGYYYFVFSGEGVNIKDYLIIKRSMR
jgi:gliding motility-associated-like protein